MSDVGSVLAWPLAEPEFVPEPLLGPGFEDRSLVEDGLGPGTLTGAGDRPWTEEVSEMVPEDGFEDEPLAVHGSEEGLVLGA